MSEQTVTIDQIHAEVHKLDPKLDEQSDAYMAAVVCLSGLVVGTSVEAISKFTGYSRGRIAEPIRRLKANRVFLDKGQVACQWFDPDGGIAFWMDVNVALGFMQRARG